MTDLARIEAELQDACINAIDGSSPGPMLYKRVRRIVEARLRRVVRGRFTVEVGPGAVPEEVSVTVLVQTPRRVERVSVNVDAM